MNTASLRVYPEVGSPEKAACFVRFAPGADVTMENFIQWMIDNDIRAVDDDQVISDEKVEFDENEVITLANKDRSILWCWMKASDAVLTRLYWADHIKK